MKIIWTPVAKGSYADIETFLITYWNVKVTQDFIIAVKKTMHIIKENPYCFEKWEHDNTYLKGYINEKISFYYKVKSNEIVVHLFWNNINNPKTLKEILEF